jgi:hypothetical protein
MISAAQRAHNAGRLKTVVADSRYTITLEFCGYATAMHVLRFCDKWIASEKEFTPCLAAAVNHQLKRIVEK